MVFRKHLRIYGLIGFALPIVFVTGCLKPSSSETSPEIGHIRNVMLLGREYWTTHKQKTPTIEQLREWAIKEKGAKEEDFISTQDGQEYLIGPGMMGGVMVFEAAGKGGVRYGTNPGGAIQEVDEQNVQGWLGGQQSGRATRGQGGAAPEKKGRK
jgi:hypothetical protein